MKYSGQYYLSSTSSYHCTLCFSETEITPLFFLFQFDISPLSTFFLEKAAIMESGHATPPPPPPPTLKGKSEGPLKGKAWPCF